MHMTKIGKKSSRLTVVRTRAAVHTFQRFWRGTDGAKEGSGRRLTLASATPADGECFTQSAKHTHITPQ